MIDIKWNKRFLELAKHISSWSKDKTKVGAVIVDPETKQVIGMGYNGFPRGVDDTEERINDRETKLHFICHAELNAILNSNRSVRGCEIYVYPTLMVPNSCPECSKAIVQSGIKKVLGYKRKTIEKRWADLEKFSSDILYEGGVVSDNSTEEEESLQEKYENLKFRMEGLEK